MRVLPPDVGQSDLAFTAVGDDVRFGLGAVRNVGAGVVTSIIAARRERGAFTDFADFLGKVPAPVCNKRVIESLARAGAFDGLGHARRGLVEVHEQAVDLAADAKKHEAHGQDSLFGAASAPDLDVVVPAGEWDRATLLAHERDMLGLYVSGHPLDGAEATLRHHRDLPIGDLTASRTGPVRISGIVSGLQRRVTKQGAPWTVLTVQDHDASVECLVFPKCHALYGDALAEDQVVSVLARVNVRDETLSLYVDEVTVLDVADGAAPPVLLRVAAARVTEVWVRELRQVLESHPGDAPVHLRLRRRGARDVLYDLTPFRVAAGSALFGELKSLLGADGVG